MKIDLEMINYLEELSRLSLNESEKLESMEALTSILQYMDKLNEVDTTTIEPLSHPFEAVNAFREDEIRPSFDRNDILANSPVKTDEFFIVPKVNI